jgi:hypothetical protein
MDALLSAFLADFPDDEACTLLATLRDGGHIVRDECTDEAFAYWTEIDGERFIGIGFSDVDAARALLLVCGGE